jgi:bleomycin hydrolase
MGGQQSKFPPSQLANEKLIIERLQALQMREHVSEDGEYICVDGNEKQRQYVSKSPSLSVSTVKRWEHELLQDPKNRLVVVCRNFVRS